MPRLRFLAAGESHGKSLIGILEGIPSGLYISAEDVDRDLKRRQMGYGRGARMKIESDHAAILSGVRWGKTIGSPVTLYIENKDWKNWIEGMSSHVDDNRSIPAVTKPRPGHADLAGAVKYDQRDLRNVLERSSARETAARVALGAIAKMFLTEFGIRIGSYVIQIGKIKLQRTEHVRNLEKALLFLFEEAEKSPVRCPDKEASGKMVELIDKMRREGNSLGGIFEVFATGVPIGLGSYIQWDKKLDGRLAKALMSIQAIKGVEIGLGFDIVKHPGSQVMDEIFYRAESIGRRAESNESQPAGFYRKSNNAGGIEGGMTNGMPIVIRAAMKPIPTLKRPLRSVDITTKKPVEATYERSDVCAVPAAGVIGEAMVALTIADVFLEKFGGDSMAETKRNYDSYIGYIRKW
ncbi:MAG: chorismate synthase [Nitrospirae bacterium RBG_13_43_8]|nr:MAG: chorismate synthase [Nitrospirae bacterium RBG_13_43_8]